jgi:hypothetical protein
VSKETGSDLEMRSGKPVVLEYAQLDYFSGTRTSLTETEFNWFSSQNAPYRVKWTDISPRGVVLADGSNAFFVESPPASARCGVHPFSVRLVVRDSSGAERHSAHILYLRDDEVVADTNAECGREAYRYRLESAWPAGLVALRDGTFVMWELRGNLIVRFDRDLRTSFQLGHRVFVIDKDEMGRILEAPRAAGVQARHDAVLRHVLSMKRGL